MSTPTVGQQVTIHHDRGDELGEVISISNAAPGELTRYTVRFSDGTISSWAEHQVTVAPMTTPRHLGRGSYVRDVPGELTSAGYPLVIHLAGRDDTSPAHRTYPTGYDSRCGWCYLGANHSVAAHIQRVGGGSRPVSTATPHQRALAGLLRADLTHQMPGCDVYVTAFPTGFAAKAIHRVTGRQLTLSIGDDGWVIRTGAGNSHSGSSAYGFDSAIAHAYRHHLDYTSDHGPGSAWDYSEAVAP